jgi:hypothetical protein
MTGISRTRPISKNIGRPMIAPTRAIAHGSARGEAWPTMVSTISSAPPESASSLANIAPNAINMPTPAAVVPKPSVNEPSTVSRFSPATIPTVRPPKISARKGCNLATVIRTTMTAMPASAARMSCQPAATGSANSVSTASTVSEVITSPSRLCGRTSRRWNRCPGRRRSLHRLHRDRAPRGWRTAMPAVTAA